MGRPIPLSNSCGPKNSRCWLLTIHLPAFQKAVGGVSECASRGAFVRPRRGDAILFFSLKPDGQMDEKSLHGGCPVIRGSKWSATKWMRVRKYRNG